MAGNRPPPLWLFSTGLKEIAYGLSREELTSRVIHLFPPATSIVVNCNTRFMLPICRRSGIFQSNNFSDDKSAPSKHFSIKDNDEVLLEANEAGIACTEVVSTEGLVTGKEHEVLLSDLGDGDSDICLMDTVEIAGRYQNSVDGQHFLHSGKASEHQSINQGGYWKEFTEDKFDKNCSLCTRDLSVTSQHYGYLNSYSESIPEFEGFSVCIPSMIEDEINNYSDLSRLTEQMLSLLEKLRKCESMLKPVYVNSRSRNEDTGGKKETGENGSSFPPVSESRASKDVEPFRKISSRSVMPGTANQRARSQAICCTGFKKIDIVPSKSSIIPLIHQRQQATTPVTGNIFSCIIVYVFIVEAEILTGKREIKIKALKVAEAAKLHEEKKQKERGMRKAAH